MGCANKKESYVKHYLSELAMAHHFFDNFYDDLAYINGTSQLIKNDLFEIKKEKLTRKKEIKLMNLESEYKQYIDFFLKIKS